MDLDVPLILRDEGGEGREVEVRRTEQLPDRVPFLIFGMRNNETDLAVPPSYILLEDSSWIGVVL